jgi:REP element-mobilizing transposase RayT
MKKLYQKKRRRRSLRLKGYDYSTSGAYFITICVQDGLNLLSEIQDDDLVLKEPACMVKDIWNAIPSRFPEVQLDALVIMPNHVHFVILLTHPDDEVGPATNSIQKRTGQTQGSALTSLPKVVQWFKSFTTARYRNGVHDNNWPPFPGRLWQRNYWERIIRNERELEAIRRYIWNNPANWKKDRLYQGNPSSW